MKTYEILIGQESKYILTDAGKMDVQKAIDFVSTSQDKDVAKLLVAVRMLGFKAREVKIEPEEVFEL